MKSTNVQTKLFKEKTMRSKIYDQILPLVGSISYELFSFYIMNPRQFSRLTINHPSIAADVLWLSSHVGIGVYLYKQDFITEASLPWKITYSVFSSAMFNFGSVLMWGTVKGLFPKAPGGINFLFGVGSGLLLLYIGWNFTDFLNTNVHKKNKHIGSESTG